MSERNELNRLKAALFPYGPDKPGRHVYLSGPVGVGKTYLVKCLPEYLKSEIKQAFFVRLELFAFDWEAHEWQDRALLEVGWLAKGEWISWRAPDDAASQFGWKLSDVDSPIQRAQSVVEQLVGLGQEFPHVIVIVDDYDRLAREENLEQLRYVNTFLLKCEEVIRGSKYKKVLSWLLTGEIAPLKTLKEQIRKLSSEDLILVDRNIDLIRCELPSREAVQDIVRKSGVKSPSADLIDEICRVSGSYPQLVVRLANNLKLSESYSDIVTKIRKASEAKAFKDDLWHLYEELSQEQRRALAFLALAEESGQDYLDLHRRWHVRKTKPEYTDDDQSRFERTLDYLAKYRLLVSRENGSYLIKSEALKELISHEREAKEIKTELSIKEKQTVEREQRMLTWLLIGIVWFLFISIPYDSWTNVLQRIMYPSPPSLAKFIISVIAFLGFVPGLFYLAKQAWRPSRSGHSSM